MSISVISLRCWILGLTLSILLHIFIFRSVIFVIPVEPPPHNPQMTFWGSILKPQDVEETLSLETTPLSYKEPQGVRKSLIEKRKSELSNVILDKPLPETPAVPVEKRILKSTFETPDIQEVDEPDTTNLGIDLNIRPYKPLTIPKP